MKFFIEDENGNITSQGFFNSETNESILKNLDEEEKEIFNPTSQFNNLESTDILRFKSEEPEPSFLQDVQRVGLKTAFGPLELASDLIIRPFSEDKEAYDKAADAFFQKSKEKVLTTFGEDDVTDVIDPATGKIRGTDTIAGTVVDIGSYIVGGGAVFKVLNKINKTRKLGNVTKAVISEQVAEQALSDPDYNLANLANDLTDEDIPFLQYLAADTDDDVLLNRAKQSIVGGLATGVVSGLVKFGFNRLEVEDYSKRIFNKDPEDLSHDVELPELVGVMAQDAKNGEIRNPSSIVKNISENIEETNEGVIQILKQSEKSLTGRIQWIKQRFFRARGFFSEEAFKAKEAAVSGTRQLVSSGVNSARRLQRFIDDQLLATGDETLAKRVMEQLQNKNLKGLSNEDRIKAIVDSGLSEDIAIEIVLARNTIDDLSRYIVDNNVATEGVREAIGNNIETYVRRSYKLYEDPDFVPLNSLKEEAKDAIKEGLSKTKKLDADELEKEANKIIDEILDKSETVRLNDYTSRIRSINDKVFSKRKDIAPEIRKLMGEITSPSENISITIQKLANITESHKFYSKLNQLGGSVPKNQALYKQAMEDARNEIKQSTDFKNLTEQFDITIPEGTLFRLDDNRTGSLVSVNSKNTGKEITVRVRDSVTGELSDVTEEISFAKAGEGFIPRTQVIRELANDIYANNYKGTMTDAKYLKAKKSDIFNTQITGTNSEIDGLFTTPEFARAVSNLEDTHMFWGAFKQGLKGNELSRYVTGAKGITQQMKTVYDHTTHLRNALGGYQFGLANGINPLTQGKFNQATLWNEIFEGNNRIFDKYYEKLQGLGVINTSVRASETRAMLEIASETRSAEGMSRLIKKLSEKYPKSKVVGKLAQPLIRKPEQIYMATDDFFKMNAFAAELSSLKKSKPNVPLQQLEEEAAEIVKNTLPNYDRVTQGVKSLRELPIGNFVSFPAEIIRTSYHIIRQGTKEVVEGASTGNVALRNRGLQRLGGFTTLNTAWFTTGYLGSKALGLSDQENESYQNLLETPFDRNHNKVIVSIGGEKYAMSPTYINSYNIYQDFALGIQQELAEGKFEGKDFTDRLGDATVRALSSVIQPFTDEAMFVETIGDIYTAIKDEQGRTPAGKQIIKDPNDPWSIAWGSLTHAGKQFTPGFVTDFKKYSEALFETPNPYTGQKRSFGASSVEMLTGINFTKFHADDRFVGHARAYNREKNYARTRPSARYGKESDDYFQEFTEYTAKKFKAAQQFYKQVQSMQDLGYTNTQISSLMQKAGLTGRIENALMLRGKFSADKLSRRQKLNMIGTLKNSGEEDPQRLIMDFLTFANGLDLSPKTNDTKKLNQDIFKELSADQFRKKFKKGGEVNVPDAKKEPDERIDRMTGLPYNIQAGTLGIDEEDPEKRLGLQEGGTLEANTIFTENDTVNITANNMRNIMLSDRDISKELATESLINQRTSIYDDDQIEFITKKKPEKGFVDKVTNFIWGRGMDKYAEAQNKIGQELDNREITPGEATLRHTAAATEMAFAPVGELLGKVADTIGKGLLGPGYGKGYLADPVVEAALDTDTAKQINNFIQKNPELQRYAKNIMAVAQIAGAPVAINIVQKGINTIAAGTKTKLDNFYNKIEGEKIEKKQVFDEDTGEVTTQEVSVPITRKFKDDEEKRKNQILTAGGAFLSATKEAVKDAFIPTHMHNARIAGPQSKRKEILTESKLRGQRQSADAFASQMTLRNILEQAGYKTGKFLKGGAMELSYVYDTLPFNQKNKIRDALFDKYNDYEIPETIKDRALNHVSKVWTEGFIKKEHLDKINVPTNLQKFTPFKERPINPKNTDVDIKRPDGVQNIGREAHGGETQHANSLGKIFSEDGRLKLATFISMTTKAGIVKKRSKLDLDPQTDDALKLNIENFEKQTKKINKDKVEDIIQKATPQQIKSYLKFQTGKNLTDKKIKFSEDPTDSNIIYFSDHHTSKSKESGGVNDFIAFDLNNFKSYVLISDKHDMFLNLNPLGGRSRLTIAPMSQRDIKNKDIKGKQTERNYKAEARAALDLLDEANLDLPKKGIISFKEAGEKGIIGGQSKSKVTRETLEKVANAKTIENRNGKYFIDGKETTKDELNGGVSVNLTVLAYYNGKATTKDFLDLARRISKVTLATDFVTGDYQKEPRQPRVLGSLIKINKPKRGKLMGALKRVAVNA